MTSYTSSYQERKEFLHRLLYFSVLFALLGGGFGIYEGQIIEAVLKFGLAFIIAILLFRFHKQPLQQSIIWMLCITYGIFFIFCYMGSLVSLWMLTLPVVCFPLLKKEQVVVVDALGLGVLLSAFAFDAWSGRHFYSLAFVYNLTAAYLVLSYGCLLFHHLVVKHRSQLIEVLVEKRKVQATQTLSAGVAHLINNKMSVVLGYASLLEGKTAYAEKIQQAAIETSQHANDLLAHAQQSVTHHYNDKIEISTCLQGCVADMQTAKGVQIKFVQEQSIWIEGNHQQLRDCLFRNVLANAVESMPKSYVHINIQEKYIKRHDILPSGEYAYIQIEDNGEGMNDDTLRQAFDPFYSTKFLGRGMGLAAAYGAVKNHKGLMMLDSVEDEGTTCHIWLPIRLFHQPQPNHASETVGHA